MNSSVDLISNNGTIGGGEIMLIAMAQALRKLGGDVRLVVPESPTGAKDLAIEHEFPVVRIPAQDRRSYLRNLATSRGRLTGDLWWCNGLVPAVALAGAHHRRIVTLHQEPTLLQRRLWQFARRGVERVYVPSASMRSRIADSVVLANWTDDLPLLAPRPTDGLQPVRVGFIGRFSPIKGLDVLARAIQRIDRTDGRKVELVLAGDSRLVPTSEAARIDEALRDVARVDRLGWVPRDEFFASVDVVAVPSVWEEPFGLVAAEAMAFGRPVVVSDAGALCEVVGPEHPWVTKAGNVADTTRVLRAFLSLDETEVARHCAAARARWEQNFAPSAGQDRVKRIAADLGLITAEPLRS